MALEMATAVQTPFPLPDMSSPRSSLVYFSFISSISEQHPSINHQKHQRTLPEIKTGWHIYTFILQGLLVHNLLQLLHAELAHRWREAWCRGRRAAHASPSWRRWRIVLLLLATAIVGERRHTEQRSRVVAIVAVFVEAREA
ncbi:Os07g0481000 [Oryza sativa Japonica Group]|uniref:Os07g0481000 protein n=1 Tax=Oryza sativa subsp. japonica TaxID=39947 RepID=A0A0P0X5U0_ORYSJ|nr:hypothetical protein EE612_039226 [Oryza sativa]BAT01485.1 Os07g0481000 [Oryza sativa Japonica Group]